MFDSYLEHDEAVLAEGRALLWEGCGCAGIGGSEIEIIICHLQSTENFGSDHKKITGNRFTHWAVSNLNGYSLEKERAVLSDSFRLSSIKYDSVKLNQYYEKRYSSLK
jgi:enhancing lycopene biosynthesis protein 2